MAYEDSDSLKTIENGKVPETRMNRADTVQSFARRLIDNDTRRAWKRARVNGLVAGNPPYKASRLREAGRAEATNVNWGIARSYMESGAGAFYDLTSESSGFVKIQTSFGPPDLREHFSRVMSSEADRIFREDRVWDYEMQQSQNNMVLHGHGPFMFEDSFRVFPKAFADGDLKVPEFTPADTHYWDAAGVFSTYYPPQLYEFIKDPEAAAAVGWNVKYTKLVIQNAMDVKQNQGIPMEWEFYQQELKNNSLAYYNDSKVCRIVHVLWKEFDGRITHAMVERDTSTGSAPVEFLYRKIGRYKNWDEVVHPMYFDRGDGGYHHSVTGLGVKMYGAMENQNRLLCNLTDKAFAPKILFKPTTSEQSQKFSLIHLGDYAVMPGGFEMQQSGIAGLANDGLAMNMQITELMKGNLSSYRQQVQPKQGNPITAKQAEMEASEKASLSKTTYNRYYRQMDFLYSEIVRRLCDLNNPDPRAKAFRERCQEKGVPRECLGRIEKVEAVRVIGQGSAFMRKAAVDAIGGIVGALPEEGRDAWLADKIAAEAGQSAVERYLPRRETMPRHTDQQAEAMQWVGTMKVGVPPIVTSTQNPATYAATFINASIQAINTVKQGANPVDVLSFVNIAGPAAGVQLKRMMNDPTRKELFDALSKQWKELIRVTDQLKALVAKQQQSAQAQQRKTQQVMSDEQLKNFEVQQDVQRKNIKAKAQMQQSATKHRQQLAIADATAASKIHRDNALAQAEIDSIETEPEPAMNGE